MKSRIRWRLLALLWVWALCIFAIVDLFMNVDEFESVRPRSGLYRGMRVAAHKMVGEPIRRQAPTRIVWAARPSTAAGIAEELAAVRELKSLSGLRAVAATAEDARVRIVALKCMTKRFGPQARGALVEAAHRDDETYKVRKQAARLIGRTGRDAEAELDAILTAELPAAVRAGAVLGLGELRTSSGATRVLAFASDADPALRTASLKALPRMGGHECAQVLLGAAQSPHVRAATRAAVCRGLSWSRDANTANVLARVLTDPSNPPEVRAAAADSLGRIGQRQALEVVRAASSDPSPLVARQSLLASTRLARVPQ